MQDLKSLFGKYLSEVEDKWDDLRASFTRRMGWNDPIQIVPFRTYGTQTRMYIKGRVLEDKNIAASTDKDTILNNLVNMYKRFESDEVANATLSVQLPGETVQIITDKEGYFILKFQWSGPVNQENLWHGIPLELISAPIAFERGLKSVAEVMIPPADAEFGVISDIDDTIVKTTATNLFAMGRTTFLNNAKTRLPFAGVSQFYKSLQLGKNGKRNNPFFYVSSSPWNLYDMLKEFLDLNEIPAGPLLLRDFGFEHKEKEEKGHLGHKLKEIKQILEAFPHLNFILIGDSGQEDPVIYREVAELYPGRILAIYIRDVQLPERTKIAIDVSESLKQQKVEMLIVDNSVTAADHAARAGFIFTETVPSIEHEKKKDKGEEPGKEELEVSG